MPLNIYTIITIIRVPVFLCAKTDQNMHNLSKQCLLTGCKK